MDKLGINILVSNIFWLFFDKGYGAILTLFIYSILAKYLGPEVFGVWNYIVAFGSLIPAFAGLGLNFIIIKKIKETPALNNIIISNTLFLRILAGVFFAGISFLIYLVVGINSDYHFLGVVLLIFISQIVLNANVFIFKNEADLDNRKTVIARNIALTIAFGLRFYGVKNELSLFFFATLNLLEYSIFWIISYFLYQKENKIFLKLNIKISKYFIKEGLPLMLSAITVILYLKVDQLIIAFLLDNDSVGIYSAASRISEMLYALPVIISSVYYPKIIEQNKNLARRKQTLLNLYGVTILSAILVSFIVSFFSENIIFFLYGSEFMEATNVLIVYSWSIVFMGLLVSSSKLLLVIGRNDIILKKSIIGLFSNIGINFLLIPDYGIIGAAWATLISYALAAYFSNIFFKDLRPVMLDQIQSIYYIFKVKKEN